MNIERAAATLPLGDEDLAPVALKHAHRGLVDLPEKHPHHTPAEHRDPGSWFANGGE